MHPGKACRRHRATRGTAANAAVACRRQRTVCLLVFKQLVCRQAPVSQQARNIFFWVTVSSLNITFLFSLQQLIRSKIYACWIIVAAISSLGTRGAAAVRGMRCRARRAATRQCVQG